MDIEFKGRLSYDLRIKDVLERILSSNILGQSILQIEDSELDLEGAIVFADSRFFVGAYSKRPPTTGYQALRHLLTLATADFSYYRLTADEHINLDRTLNIDLQAIIPWLPDLPTNASSIFDQKTLLDRVFGPASFESITEAILPPSELIHDTDPPLIDSENLQQTENNELGWVAMQKSDYGKSTSLETIPKISSFKKQYLEEQSSISPTRLNLYDKTRNYQAKFGGWILAFGVIASILILFLFANFLLIKHNAAQVSKEPEQHSNTEMKIAKSSSIKHSPHHNKLASRPIKVQ